jgi:hypothetical protein
MIELTTKQPVRESGGFALHNVTVRDFFAAAALIGIYEKEAFCDDIAQDAFIIADAMLDAREHEKHV